MLRLYLLPFLLSVASGYIARPALVRTPTRAAMSPVAPLKPALFRMGLDPETVAADSELCIEDEAIEECIIKIPGTSKEVEVRSSHAVVARLHPHGACMRLALHRACVAPPQT